jgi:hypothetical protein
MLQLAAHAHPGLRLQQQPASQAIRWRASMEVRLWWLPLSRHACCKQVLWCCKHASLLCHRGLYAHVTGVPGEWC